MTKAGFEHILEKISIQNTGFVLLAIPGSLPVKISIYINTMIKINNQSDLPAVILFYQFFKTRREKTSACGVCVCVCVCASVYVCVCACERAHVRGCVCVHVCVSIQHFRAPQNPKSVRIHALGPQIHPLDLYCA